MKAVHCPGHRNVDQFSVVNKGIDCVRRCRKHNVALFPPLKPMNGRRLYILSADPLRELFDLLFIGCDQADILQLRILFQIPSDLLRLPNVDDA